MAIKGNKIIDLITGDYNGRWPQRYKTTENGKKPIIRPSGFNSAQVFPHPLKPEKHVREVTTEDGRTIHVLVPDSDIYNFNKKKLEKTPWFKLSSEREDELSEKDKKIERLKDRIAEKEDEIERLSDEDAKSKHGSNNGSNRSGQRLSCFECNKVHRRSEWEQNGGMCPWCEQSSINEAEVIN